MMMMLMTIMMIMLMMMMLMMIMMIMLMIYDDDSVYDCPHHEMLLSSTITIVNHQPSEGLFIWSEPALFSGLVSFLFFFLALLA